MKNATSTTLFLMFVLFLVGCKANQQDSATQPNQRVIGSTPVPPIVEKVPTTIKAEHLNLAPGTRGGKPLFQLGFLIRVQFPDEGNIGRSVVRRFFSETETGQEIQEGRRIYALIKKIDPAQVRVFLESGRIVKIQFQGQMIGREQLYHETLWEEDMPGAH